MVIKKGTETIYDKILEISYSADLCVKKQDKIYMLWFNFILGLNFISLCFKLIINITILKNKGKYNLNQG